MRTYLLSRVRKRITSIERKQFVNYVEDVLVTNISLKGDYLLADVKLIFEESSIIIPGRMYLKCLFVDCEDISSASATEKADKLSYADARYHRILKRLLRAEQNEEDVILSKVKEHIGKIGVYYRWMKAPEEPGYAPVTYYADKLIELLDIAEEFLINLYT